MSIFDSDYALGDQVSWLDLRDELNANAQTWAAFRLLDQEGYSQYPWKGSWSVNNEPRKTLIIDNDNVFQIHRFPLDNPHIHKLSYHVFGQGNSSKQCLLETNPICFNSLAKVKYLNALKIAFKGSGNYYPKVKIGGQQNYSDVIEWIEVPVFVDKTGHILYYLRNVSQYKIYRFQIYWNNTEHSYISELSSVSIEYEPLDERR